MAFDHLGMSNRKLASRPGTYTTRAMICIIFSIINRRLIFVHPSRLPINFWSPILWSSYWRPQLTHLTHFLNFMCYADRWCLEMVSSSAPVLTSAPQLIACLTSRSSLSTTREGFYPSRPSLQIVMVGSSAPITKQNLEDSSVPRWFIFLDEWASFLLFLFLLLPPSLSLLLLLVPCHTYTTYLTVIIIYLLNVSMSKLVILLVFLPLLLSCMFLSSNRIHVLLPGVSSRGPHSLNILNVTTYKLLLMSCRSHDFTYIPYLFPITGNKNQSGYCGSPVVDPILSLLLLIVSLANPHHTI